jgi:hypothetical protein
MSQNHNYLNKVYGKHTVALEFLAEAGINTVKNVIKSPELGKKLVGVSPNPNLLRLNAQYAQYGRYPKVLQNLG